MTAAQQGHGSTSGASITWPPSKGELWAADPDTRTSSYDARLSSELNSSVSYFRELDEEQQHEVLSIVRWLDMIAGQALNNLRNSPWTEWERRLFPLSKEKRLKDKRTEAAWEADHTDQLCIDSARRAREAIFVGNWIAATKAGFEAVQHSRARSAEIGWKVRSKLPRKGSHRMSAGLSSRDRRIAEEAAALNASKPNLSDSVIAERIANRHAGEPGHPKAGRIRQILRHDKSWKRKVCVSNNPQLVHCKPDRDE